MKIVHRAIIFPVISSLFLLLHISESRGELIPRVEPKPVEYVSTIADNFVDEELTYRVGYWVFSDVAEGVLSLKKESDTDYVATLKAYTTGAFWGIIKRSDVYISHMKLSPDGKRFLPSTFEKRIEIRGKTRYTLTKIDLEKGLVTWKSWGGGVEDKNGEAVIPPGNPADDPIVAFYNFRYGVYGKPEFGKEFKIFTSPKSDKPPHIYMRVAAIGEKGGKLKYNSASEYMVFATIEKELFGSQTGELEIVFGKDMVPLSAVVKDVLMFGDITGKLIKVSAPLLLKSSPQISTPAPLLPRPVGAD